ncbi:DUF3299 domain-containing protein [Hyphomonas sp. FCG-A18]|uniref:DUF3299 domain-containing protein n=1 Tax=Hyphomonas sp. FCG-A18 TaxID=3080019 RepID=UPI002B2DF355|nr:DUF3299 domain-containing protein [Hyphomonas sp. FCG-A18]
MSRMMRPIILAGLFAVAACGGVETDTPAAAQTAPASTAAAETSTQPQVGDRIPQPARANRSTASNRLATAGAAEISRDLSAYRELGWEELMPPGEEERLAQIYQQQMAMLYSSPIAEGSAADAMVQIGTFNTVKELNETKIRIPGYTVPFEYGSNAMISEFLLVPYYGACIHAPPPPPNQTIFVMADEPIKLRDLAQAVWINGTIYTQTQESELADAAYTIKVDSVEVYEY